MFVFLNGEFVPQDRAVVSVFDRGFLYGDGLFETMRVFGGRPFRWGQHLERLQRGAEFLGIRLPLAASPLRERALELIQRNAMPDAVLRLALSRGTGPRGYSPAGADSPTLAISLHPAPEFDWKNPPQWRLATATHRLGAGNPLDAFKTANQLAQVVARGEADARGADEALLLNAAGDLVEASSSNVFWIEAGTVFTPRTDDGALPGVTRAVVLELCQEGKIVCAEKSAPLERWRQAEGVFLTNSAWGIVEANELDGTPLRTSPLTKHLQAAYRERLEMECGPTENS
jgi:aminodeoxychorismate lyase